MSSPLSGGIGVAEGNGRLGDQFPALQPFRCAVGRLDGRLSCEPARHLLDAVVEIDLRLEAESHARAGNIGGAVSHVSGPVLTENMWGEAVAAHRQRHI